ncbi:MAG: ATP-binding protein [Ktedonobacterales bacterium]
MGPANRPELGTFLRRHRVEAGLTQEELAERSEVSARTISDLERGLQRHSRRDTLALLAQALALSDRERAILESLARQQPLSTLDVSPAQRRAAIPSLVGRAQELALLERHLAGEGPPVLMLAGEPGIGKTRLLREAAERGREQGWTVLEGGCQRRSGQEPYTPLLDALLRSLTQRSPARQKLDLQGCAWLVRLLPELAESSLVGVPQWSHPPEQERRLMFTAARRYLVNVAGPCGTLLVLDDLQWAGQDALDLLAFLLHAPRELGRTDEPVGLDLRVVAACRSTEVRPVDPLGVLLADLTREELATSVKLGPLTPEAASELVRALLADLPGNQDERRQQLVERTDRVPYFLVSWAQALHSQAYDRGNGEAVEEGSGKEDSQLPWTVTQSIRQRLALLPEAARDLVNVLAVSGREAAIPVLLAVAARTGRERAEMLAAVERACQAGLLVEDRGKGYAFAHDLIREVAVADLGAARRATLHSWIGEAILQSTPQGREPRAAELAWHFIRGGDPGRALPYALQAGEQAEVVYAHAEAEKHYRMALELSRELGDRRREAEVLEQLADVVYGTGRLKEMLALLGSAAEIQRAAGNLDQFAWDIAHMTRPYSLLRPPDGFLARLQTLQTLLTFLATQAESSDGKKRERQLQPEGVQKATRQRIRPVEPDESVAHSPSLADLAARAVPVLSARTAGHVYYSLAFCLLYLGRYWEAVPLGKSAVSYAQAAGDRWLQVRSLVFLGEALIGTGQLAETLAACETAKLVAQEADDLEGIGMAELNVGDFLMYRGAFAEAMPHLQQALEAAERYGMPDNVAQVLCHLAWISYNSGAWDQTLNYCQRAAEHVRTLGIDSVSAWIALQQGRIYLSRGEAQPAQECLAEAIEQSERQGQSADCFVLTEVHTILAETDLLHGDAAAALARLELWLDRTTPLEQAMAGPVPQVAWACLELGEVERAAALLSGCLEQAREQQYHLLLADALRIQALLALRRGRWQEAAAALDEALALARTMPCPYAEAKALCVYGDLHAACGLPEQACEKYAAALAILSRLGERLYAERVEWALAGVNRQ